MIYIKKLPKIYQNNIDKKINNNEKTYYVKNNNNNFSRNSMTNESDIEDIIDEIFLEDGYSFNKQVIIETNTKTYDTSIITRTNGYLLTMDNDKIKIEDIVSIKRKNPI